MKNIKKYYPLIVGLVLLISVAAYGTRAYFSDSTKQDAGIELQLGKVKVTGDPGNWNYNNTGKNDNQLRDKTGKLLSGKNLNPKETLTNVKPGDSFSKIFTFTNESSLITTFNFTEDILEAEKGIFDIKYEVVAKDEAGNPHSIKIEDLKKNNSLQLQGNESAEVTMILEVQSTDDEKYMNTFNSGNEEFFQDSSNIIDLMGKTIKVDLKQAE